MSQHLSQSDIQEYLNRTAPPERLLAADAHLGECEACFALIAELRSAATISVAALSDFPADDGMDLHLTYDQLAAYVDDEIGDVDREIVDVHRAVCRECSGQINELRYLRSTLQLETETSTIPKAPAAGSPLSRLWNGITTGAFLKFAAPAFALLLLGVVVWSVWMLTGARPAEIVEVIDPTSNKPVGETNVSAGNANLATDGMTNTNAVPQKPATSLVDGASRVEIDDKGNLTGLNTTQFDARVKAALTTQNIEISLSAKELRSRSGVLMGEGQSGVPFALTAPLGRIVESDQPQFRWHPLAGAASYSVTVFDSNFNKVTESPVLRQPVWTPSARLKRGPVYQWQVTALKDGQEIKSPVRPAPDARFKVVDAGAASEIDMVRRTNGNSHLLLGIVYANAGLLDEAEREFTALLQKNPNSEVARKLLNKVKAAR